MAGDADIAWLMTSSALVLLMIPGVCLFYSGASDRNSAIQMVKLPIVTAAVVWFQWYLWGYCITFSPPALNRETDRTSFYGNSIDALAFHKVLDAPISRVTPADPGPDIPEIVFALYQGMFASFTAALVSGGVYRKVKTGRFLFFIVAWSTLVYDPIARWTWHQQGWQRRAGSLDFAGGSAVHICSGASAAAYACFFKLKVKRSSSSDQNRLALRDRHLEYNSPRNVTHIVLGTALLWVGWLGFNGGSALGANTRAVSACLSSMVAAGTGGAMSLTYFWFWNWTVKETEDFDPTRFSIVTFCDGVIIGLVAITPAAGYVRASSAPAFGIVASIICYHLKQLTTRFLEYDLLDVFVVHGGGGFVGMLLTGLLADETVVHLDGYSVLPYKSKGLQFAHQLEGAVAAGAYSFFVTFMILGLLAIPRIAYWWNAQVDAAVIEDKVVAVEQYELRGSSSAA